MKADELQTKFSPDRVYRYSLVRQWYDEFPLWMASDPGPYAMFIGLNPSTADEVQNDPTVRRCIGYAKAWGYGALVMTNIFAYRSTDPKCMREVADPVGPDNDATLQGLAAGAGIVVAAWGAHGTHRGRADQIKRMIPKLHCLKLTKDGHPAHPLYLKKDLTPAPLA